MKCYKYILALKKDKNTDSIDNVMLIYSRMKFVVVPLFILYVVTCMQS